MRGRSLPYYGKLNVKSLPHEVHQIWLTRNSEPEECEPAGFSWMLATDPDEEDRRDLARRLVEITPLTEQEELVVRMCVLEGATLKEAGDELGGRTTERVRQILLKGLRRFRKHQRQLTGVDPWDIDDRVMPYFWWRIERKQARRTT